MSVSHAPCAAAESLVTESEPSYALIRSEAKPGHALLALWAAYSAIFIAAAKSTPSWAFSVGVLVIVAVIVIGVVTAMVTLSGALLPRRRRTSHPGWH